MEERTESMQVDGRGAGACARRRDLSSARRCAWCRRWGALLLAAGAVTAAPAARAQDAPAGAAASQEANAFFKKGNDLYRSGDFRGAYQAYRKAWELKQSYAIAANLGSAELQLGMKPEAAEHFAFCIRSFPATGDRAQLEAVKAMFESAREETGALLVRVSVEGAEVFVDGKPVGRSPIDRELFVAPGPRVIEAKLARYTPARQEVLAMTGPAQEVTLTLAPGPTPSAGEAGGEHMKAGGSSVPYTSVLIAGGATAGAALVMGVVFTVIANGAASDAEEQYAELRATGGPAACGQETLACSELRGSLEAKADFSNAAFWSFLGAGIAGAATGVYALVAPRAAVAPTTGVRATAVPVVTAGGGGVVIRGAW